MWIGFILLLTAWCLWSTVKVGRFWALGSTVTLSLLAPTWILQDFGPLQVDLRVAAAAVALSIYCLHPRTRLRTPLVATDLLLILMAVIHVSSDIYNEGFHWTMLPRVYGEWGLAYIAGRLAIQSFADLKRLLPLMCLICTILSTWGVVEAVTRVNPINYLVGQRPEDMSSLNAVRLGLRRAEGPVRNPIYFGVLQLLLLPWALAAANRAKHSQGPVWWRLTPWLVGVGILSTMARGPTLAYFGSLYLAALALQVRWRKPLIAMGLVTALVLVWQRDSVISAFQLWSGPNKGKIVTIEGKPYEYTATSHRWLMWKVYSKPMQRAGWLGFGTERIGRFPPNVPFGATGREAIEKLKFVDNTYILVDLRFGILGTTCFAAFLIASIVSFYRLFQLRTADERVFCAAMASVLVMIMLVLCTVWMPHDFGFLLLWTAGVGAGLWVAVRNEPPSVADESQ